MRAALVASLLVVAPAVAHARPCKLTVVRAPDDVRAVIEERVRAEPTCSAALEVRIVEVDDDGGLYVFARDDQGHTRDRVVPDAETLGVLIASWMADDGYAAPAREPEPAPAPARTIPVPEVASLERIAEPTHVPAVVTGATWQLSAAFGSEDAGSPFAARLEVDLHTFHGFRTGIAVTLGHAANTIYRQLDSGDIDWYTTQMTATIARSVPIGPIALRGTLGAGFVATYVEGTLYDYQDPNQGAYATPQTWGLYPTVEAALDVRVAGTDDWQLEAGPYARVLAERFELEMPAGGDIPARGIEAMFRAAIRWRR